MSFDETDDTRVTETAQEPPAPPEAPRRGGWHTVSIGHLVMGLVFLTFVGIWALVQSGAVEWHDMHWLLPLPWLIAGSAGLIAVAISGIRKHR